MEDQGTTFSDFIGGLFNTATGVFDTLADIELGRAELDLEKERRKAEQQAIKNGLVTTNASEGTGVYLSNTAADGAGSFQIFGIRGEVVLLAAGVLVALLVARKIKL